MGERVLVLDDEVAILDILEQYLSTEGYECVLTATAHRAFEELGGNSFAVVLVDLGLPDMDGIEVVRKVREADAEIGIIVITGLNEVTAAVQAMRSGADDYLLKPLNFNEISVSVSKVLEKRHLIIENRRHQEELEGRIQAATEDLERTNGELASTKEYLENLLHSTVDAILTSDRDGNISFVNEGGMKMLGYARDQLLGKPVAELLVTGQDEVQYLRRALRDDKPLQNYETDLRHKDGSLIPVNMSVSQVRDADGQIVSWLAICKDITEQKRLEQELKEMSIKDSLTGLYNHRHFYDRLEPEVERARRQKHGLSLLLMDLDQFKWYNDQYGHFAGDNVLRAVGEVIREWTREHVDMGFRYGGDEFTVILPEADERQAHHIAERIRSTFLQRHFERVTISCGVVAYQAEYSVRKFIQAVDAMMYEAKRTGGNRVCVFDAEVCERVLRQTQRVAAPAQQKEQA